MYPVTCSFIKEDVALFTGGEGKVINPKDITDKIIVMNVEIILTVTRLRLQENLTDEQLRCMVEHIFVWMNIEQYILEIEDSEEFLTYKFLKSLKVAELERFETLVKSIAKQVTGYVSNKVVFYAGLDIVPVEWLDNKRVYLIIP